MHHLHNHHLLLLTLLTLFTLTLPPSSSTLTKLSATHPSAFASAPSYHFGSASSATSTHLAVSGHTRDLALVRDYSSFLERAGNLLVNGNFETGTLAGWTPSVPSSWQALPCGSFGLFACPDGAFFAFAGDVSPVNLTQVVDLPAPLVDEVVAGTQHFLFGGWIRTWLQEPSDTAQIDLEFLDAAGASIASLSTGALDSQSQAEWRRAWCTVLAPSNARRVRITLEGVRAFAETGDNDAYFDSVVLVPYNTATSASFSSVLPEEGECDDSIFSRASDNGAQPSNMQVTIFEELVESATIAPSNASTDFDFGRALQLCPDGDLPRLVVGDNEAAHVYELQYGAWSLVASVAEVSAAVGNLFGSSVACSSSADTIAVGAPQSGTVTIYSRLSAYSVVDTLSLAQGRFGHALAITHDGSMLFVGAPHAGEVRVFAQSQVHGWQHSSTIAPAASDFIDLFGYSLAITSTGSTLCVGMPGANSVHCYLPTTNTTLSSESASFGAALALSDTDVLLVGTEANVVHVAAPSNPSNTMRTFSPYNVEPDSGFGHSVSVSRDGTVAVATAPFDNARLPEAGSALAWSPCSPRPYLSFTTSEEFETTSTLQLGSTFTFSYWFQATNSVGRVINYGTSDNAYQRFVMGIRGDNAFTCSTLDFTARTVVPVAPSFAAEWHHYACVMDSVNDRVSYYVDGEFVANSTAASDFSDAVSDNLRLNLIGGSNVHGTEATGDGNIAFLAAWSRALTGIELKHQVQTFTYDSNQLEVLYEMNSADATTGTIPDASGSGNAFVRRSGSTVLSNDTFPFAKGSCGGVQAVSPASDYCGGMLLYDLDDNWSSEQVLNLDPSFTIAFWSKIAFGRDSRAFQHGDDGVSNGGLLMGMRGDKQFTCSNSAANLVTPVQAAPFFQTWHHYACVWDASTSTLSIYVDGVQAASSSTISNYQAGAQTLKIAPLSESIPVRDFQVSHLTVYTRALSTEEIEYQLNSGIVDTTGLVMLNGMYTFDEPARALTDVSPSGNDMVGDSSATEFAYAPDRNSMLLRCPVALAVETPCYFLRLTSAAMLQTVSSIALADTSFAFAFWMRVGDTDALSQGKLAYSTFQMRWTSSGFVCSLDASHSVQTTQAAPGEWNHFMCSYGRHSKLLQLFVNGNLVDSHDAGSSYDFSPPPSTLQLGNGDSLAVLDMDNVVLYSFAGGEDLARYAMEHDLYWTGAGSDALLTYPFESLVDSAYTDSGSLGVGIPEASGTRVQHNYGDARCFEGSVPPMFALSSITMQLLGAPGSAFVAAGKTLQVTAASSSAMEPLLDEVTFLGQPAARNVSATNATSTERVWNINYEVPANAPQGELISFSLTFVDSSTGLRFPAGTAVTSGVPLRVDSVAPVASLHYAGPTVATGQVLVEVQFDSNQTILGGAPNAPVLSDSIQLDFAGADVSVVDISPTGAAHVFYVVLQPESSVTSFTVNLASAEDEAGNIVSPASPVPIAYDGIQPSISSVNITTPSPRPLVVFAGDQVTISLEASETLQSAVITFFPGTSSAVAIEGWSGGAVAEVTRAVDDFDPAGAMQVRAFLVDDAGNSAEIDLVIDPAITVAAAELEASPDFVAFGTWPLSLGSPAPQSVTISSLGPAELVVSSIDVNPVSSTGVGLASLPSLPLRLAAGQSVSFNVTISLPESYGTVSADVVITSNGVGAPHIVHAVIALIDVVGLPNVVSFRRIARMREAAERVVTVYNGSPTVALNLHSIQLEHADTPFSVQADLPVLLQPGEGVPMTVYFHPTSIGSFANTILVFHNGSFAPSPGPVLLLGTGEFASCDLRARPGNATVRSSTRGGVNASVDVELLDTTLAELAVWPNVSMRVDLGPGGDPAFASPPCTQLAPEVLNPSTLRVSCLFGEGRGSRVDVEAIVPIICGMDDWEAVVAVEFDPPQLAPNSLQLVDSSKGVANNGAVALASSSSTTLRLIGTNFGARGAIVRYGVPPDFEFTCQVLSMSHDWIECRTQGQESIDDFDQALFFNVAAGDQNSGAANTNNTLKLFSVPVIDSVSGCDDDGSGTLNCPIGGGTALVVRGTQFQGDGELQILISSQLCNDLETVDNTEVRCNLPAGRGARVLVTPVFIVNCSSAGAGLVHYGTPKPLLSYAPPVIDSLSSPGCASVDSTTLTSCPRTGGVRLYVTGRNFGDNDWRINVGSSECGDIQFEYQDGEQTQLSCDLPEGTVLNRLVSVADGSGQASTSNAQVSYRQCVAGEIGVGLECRNCTRGTFSAVDGATACTNCTLGRASAVEGATMCTVCPAGRFAGTEGALVCDQCEAGTAQPLREKTFCSPCLAGTFQNQSGQAECRSCPRGSIAAGSRATECTPCRPGTLEEDRKSCTPCSFGRASVDPTDEQCSLCPAGTFSNETGLTGCFECAPGTFTSLQGSSLCRPCPQGSIAPDYGSEACTSCDDGFVAEATGATSCRPCELGEVEVEHRLCKECNAGKFSPRTSADDCVQCPPGTFSSEARSTECTACPIGRYQGEVGQPLCLECPQGRFASRTGLVECRLCEPGKITSGVGADECTLCPNGTLAVNQKRCEPCPIGTVSTSPRAPRCSNCPSGKFANATGLSVCTDCSPGRFIDREAASQCLDCERGKSMNETGASVCVPCSRNFVSIDKGAKQCTECPTLAYTKTTGAAACETCVGGEYVRFAHTPDPTGPFRQYDTCLECPSGASCDGSGAAAADPDVWVVRSLDGSVQSSRCLPGRCERCPRSVVETSSSAAVSCCTDRRKPADENPMCAQCRTGFVEWGGECIECEETNWLLLGTILLGMGVCVAVLHFAMNQQSNPLALVFFYYAQMVLLLFGEETEWLAWTSFFNFNPLASAGGGQCVAPWSPVTKLALGALSPMLTWLFLAVIAAVHAFFRLLQRRPGRRDWAGFAAPYLRSCLAFFLFCYNSIVQAALRFFECVDVADGRWTVVRSAPEIDCTSSEYKNARPLFLGCGVFAVVGPCLIMYWLHQPRLLKLAGRVLPEAQAQAAADGPPNLLRAASLKLTRAATDVETPVDEAYKHRWGILFEMYRSEQSWLSHVWNVIVLCRRVLVIAVGVVLLKYGHRTKLAGLTLVHILVLCGHMYVRPFRDMTIDGVFINPDQGTLEVGGHGRVLRVNNLETISLALLPVFSAVIGAIDLPFTTTQSIALAVPVFGWMAVLQFFLVWRIVAKRLKRLKARKLRKAAQSKQRFALGAAPVGSSSASNSRTDMATIEVELGLVDPEGVAGEEQEKEVHEEDQEEERRE